MEVENGVTAEAALSPERETPMLDLSVVMPCLNESPHGRDVHSEGPSGH